MSRSSGNEIDNV